MGGSLLGLVLRSLFEIRASYRERGINWVVGKDLISELHQAEESGVDIGWIYDHADWAQVHICIFFTMLLLYKNAVIFQPCACDE